MSQLSHEELVEAMVKCLLLNDAIGRGDDSLHYWNLIYANKPSDSKNILDQEFCKEALSRVDRIRSSELWKVLE